MKFRWFFLLAAAYNFLFAALFSVHPEIFLGGAEKLFSSRDLHILPRIAIPIALMGFVYLLAVLKSRPIFHTCLLALTTKIIPPVIVVAMVVHGYFPMQTLIWPVINDLVWLPFLIRHLLNAAQSERGIVLDAHASWWRQLIIVAQSSKLAGALTTVLAVSALSAFTVLLSVNIFRNYGFALFMFSPLLFSVLATLLYSSKRETSFGECFGLSLLTIAISMGILLTAAIEGLICVILASPLIAVQALIGVVIGRFVLLGGGDIGPTRVLCLALLNPALIAGEATLHREVPILKVQDQIIISAPPDKIWARMTSSINFSTEHSWLARLGATFPKSMQVAAVHGRPVLRCTHSQGVSEFPISSFVPGKLIAFTPFGITPAPMVETSWVEMLHAPHLAGHLQVIEGAIEIRPLAGGKSELVATTQYQHAIWPIYYWQTFSSFAIGAMHRLVLNDLKMEIERGV